MCVLRELDVRGAEIGSNHHLVLLKISKKNRGGGGGGKTQKGRGECEDQNR